MGWHEATKDGKHVFLLEELYGSTPAIADSGAKLLATRVSLDCLYALASATAYANQGKHSTHRTFT